jgi:hypothetical protein
MELVPTLALRGLFRVSHVFGWFSAGIQWRMFSTLLSVTGTFANTSTAVAHIAADQCVGTEGAAVGVELGVLLGVGVLCGLVVG